MPMQVRIGLLLIGAALLVGLINSLSKWTRIQTLIESASGAIRYIFFGSLVFGIVLTVGIMAALAWRKNWARITQLVLTVLSLVMLFIGPQYLGSPPSTTIDSVSIVVNIVATYLLFSAGGKVWFRRDEPEHV